MILNCTHREQECIPVGCVPSAAVGVCWRGGVCSRWGGLLPGRVSALGSVCSWGDVCYRGVYPSMHWGRRPPVNRMTYRCKNIIFPQLRLRTVKMKFVVCPLDSLSSAPLCELFSFDPGGHSITTAGRCCGS